MKKSNKNSTMNWTFFFLVITFPLYSLDLLVKEKEIQIKGKKATIYTLEQPNGTFGIYLDKNQNFDVFVKNQLNVPTSIHWHGLILPNRQDGVAGVTQLPIYPNEVYPYQFPLLQSGTFWMHAHYDLQTQKMLSAPLILKNPKEKTLASKDYVIFFSDFTFESPEKILENLRCGKKKETGIDVNYDAFLANLRTLEDPEILKVTPGEKVRLRLINGASSTNFFVTTAPLESEVIAVDGNRIAPLKGNEFELGVAQRLDFIVKIPEEGGAFPILAQGEMTSMRTGVILSTPSAKIPYLDPTSPTKKGLFTNKQESLFSPLFSLPVKKIDQKIVIDLGGDMENYVWTINGQAWPNVTPLVVKPNTRVEITFNNKTMMSHPMHLHGHVFQISAIQGNPIKGALRDTILIPPSSSLSIQFEANNPGAWPLHCHLLYHQESGMMTVLRYER